jgi:hypothetical protein
MTHQLVGGQAQFSLVLSLKLWTWHTSSPGFDTVLPGLKLIVFWMSLLRPFSKLRINHFITICQLRTKLFIPDAHFPVPLSTSFYLTFTSTPVTSPVGLLVIPATRTDGLLHLALFRQHVLTCSPIHLSQFVMRTTFLLATRNGSYGLLRRPIRYNTLLIPNTRMIRKRIYAILEGTLGLHQPPSNHHELSPQPPEHYNASW